VADALAKRSGGAGAAGAAGAAGGGGPDEERLYGAVLRDSDGPEADFVLHPTENVGGEHLPASGLNVRIQHVFPKGAAGAGGSCWLHNTFQPKTKHGQLASAAEEDGSAHKSSFALSFNSECKDEDVFVLYAAQAGEQKDLETVRAHWPDRPAPPAAATAAPTV
jgi:hypothetical protein